MKKIVIGLCLVGLLLGLFSAQSWAGIKKPKNGKDFVCNMKQAKMPAGADEEVKTTGKFNVAILMVYPSGGSPPDWGEEDLKELFTESKFSPKNFIDENSKGKLEVNFQYFGWGGLPYDMDYYSETALGVSEGAILLFDDVIDWREYDSAFLIINDNNYHNVAAIVGSVGYNTNDGKVYLPYVITSNGLYDGYQDVGTTTSSTGFVTSLVSEFHREYYVMIVCYHLAHELLHNLGLRHNLGWVTSDESECHSCDKLNDPENSSCEIEDYEGWSAMGNKYLNLSCQEKSQLGWIDDSEILEVKTSQTIWLNQRNAESGDKYFKIPAGLNKKGTQTYFFVEYITPVDNSNFDFMFDYIKYSNLGELSDGDDNRAIMVTYWPGGQVIGEHDPYTMGTLLTYLKGIGSDDSDPWYGYPWRIVLSGSTTTWCDHNRGLSINVLQETGETAEDAQVQLQVQFECPEEPYYIATEISGDSLGSLTAHAGEDMEIPLTLSAEDTVGAGLDCGPFVYSLGVEAPEGWSASLSSWSADLKAGETASFNLSVSVPEGAEAGDYELTISASDSGYGTEKKITVAVFKEADYAFKVTGSWVNPRKIKRGAKVERHFSIYDNSDRVFIRSQEIGLTDCVLTKPDGSEEKMEITKDESHYWATNLIFSYKTKKSDPLGKYKAKITATVPRREHNEEWTGEIKFDFKVVENKSKNGKKIAILE